MIVTPETTAAEVLGSLRNGSQAVSPTERWDDQWAVELTTKQPNVYGLYARSVALTKWLSRGVRDLLDHYPGDVGGGSMPQGLAAFTVPDSEATGLGSWVLLYVGQSTEVKMSRIVQYFGTGTTFTRGPGGQSLHLTLGLLFGGEVDPRDALDPKASSLEYVLRGSLSLRLEARMREMKLSYVQVLTPPLKGTPSHHDAGCQCQTCSEQSVLKFKQADPGTLNEKTWARPLINSRW